MPLPPLQPQDIFSSALALQGQSPKPADGFAVDQIPASTGLGTRTGTFPNEVGGMSTRKLVHWLVPEGPIISMYCNPQSITYNHTKNIENQRTKGGFVIQYWGEALSTLDIQGTTGTSGIEGINVLYDIYRNEQLAYDPFALFLAAKSNQDTFAGDIFGSTSAFSSGESFLGALAGASEEAFPKTAKQGPTLASLATQVEMYWSGEVYRGYFNSFTVAERADNLGLFDYTIKFTVTQKRGYRRNFLGWHRSATNGPSNSNPEYGTPHTFGSLINGTLAAPARAVPTTLTEGFNQIGDFVSQIGSGKSLL
jgi:hypothetical protein